MTCQDLALPTELLEQIAEPGLDSLPELIPLLLKPPGQLKANLIWLWFLTNDQPIDQLRPMDINPRRSRLA